MPPNDAFLDYIHAGSTLSSLILMPYNTSRAATVISGPQVIDAMLSQPQITTTEIAHAYRHAAGSASFFILFYARREARRHFQASRRRFSMIIEPSTLTHARLPAPHIRYFWPAPPDDDMCLRQRSCAARARRCTRRQHMPCPLYFF